ncbi:synaptonemal complex protein 3-like, partial [Otolemur garnettii]|uniref:synaptonemal complex protein 3-like n=1 Tax=Otolemur garnettii TaxID=30611 RepID=UPI000C7F2352
MEKVWYAKRKRFEMTMKPYIKNIQQTIDHVSRTQREQRQKLCQEYFQQFLAMIQEYKLGAQKLKEEEEKLVDILQQLQTVSQQLNNVHRRRMNQFKKLFQAYLK